jgi:hypothetical protein
LDSWVFVAGYAGILKCRGEYVYARENTGTLGKERMGDTVALWRRWKERKDKEKGGLTRMQSKSCNDKGGDEFFMNKT